MKYFPLIVVAAVFLLIVIRQIGRFRLQIWQIMLAGALALLATGWVTPMGALRAINVDVIVFLFGMFILGEALVESGYLYHLSYAFFNLARNTNQLVLMVLLIMGVFSALLMNETVAIIGTPLVLFLAEKNKISHKLLLLSLCFATTIGSVLSPIGNPQNLLIAVNTKLSTPFITFLKYLALPSIINLFLTYGVLRLFYRSNFNKDLLERPREEIKDPKLAQLCKVSIKLLIALVPVKIVSAHLNIGYVFRLSDIALAVSLPIIILSPRRSEILRNINWHTLVFFMSLFIVMTTAWNSGSLQSVVNMFAGHLSSVDLILVMSLSLGLAKVPFVALFLPIANHLQATTTAFMALASGSTIAGNLLTIGAASNMLVIQSAEKKGKTLTFLEFALVGVPLTLLNIIVYKIFLSIM